MTGGTLTEGKRDQRSVTVPDSDGRMVEVRLSVRKGTSWEIDCLAAARSVSVSAKEERGETAKCRTAYA